MSVPIFAWLVRGLRLAISPNEKLIEFGSQGGPLSFETSRQWVAIFFKKRCAGYRSVCFHLLIETCLKCLNHQVPRRFLNSTIKAPGSKVIAGSWNAFKKNSGHSFASIPAWFLRHLLEKKGSSSNAFVSNGVSSFGPSQTAKGKGCCVLRKLGVLHGYGSKRNP